MGYGRMGNTTVPHATASAMSQESDQTDEQPLRDEYLQYPSFQFSFVNTIGPSDDSHFAESLLLGFTAVIGLAGNAAALVYFLCSTSRRKTSSILFINLLLSNILWLSTGPSLVTARYYNDWLTGKVTCQLLPYITAVTSVVPLQTQAIVAYCQYRGLKRFKILQNAAISKSPSDHRCTVIAFLIGCAIVWSVNLALLYPLFHFSKTTESVLWPDDANRKDCVIQIPEETNIHTFFSILLVYVLILGCVIPLIVTITCYARILAQTKHCRCANPDMRSIRTHSKSVNTRVKCARDCKKILSENSTSFNEESLSEEQPSCSKSWPTRNRNKIELSPETVTMPIPPLQRNARKQRNLSKLYLTLFLFTAVAWTPSVTIIGSIVMAFSTHEDAETVLSKHSTAFVWFTFASFLAAIVSAVVCLLIDGNLFRIVKRICRKRKRYHPTP